ncbi:MAG: cache domain-containing protein [Anaerohalosphaera sp.]|nr:cache domain-containing protein [Anaerohalosphaera sp.]
MKPTSLKTRIFSFFATIVIVLGLFIFLLGFSLIKTNVIGRAQQQLEHDLASARYVYSSDIERIGDAFKLTTPDCDIDKLNLKAKTGLDYIRVVNADKIGNIKSEIAAAAIRQKTGLGGTRLIGTEEIGTLGQGVAENKSIEIKDTPHAKPSTKRTVKGLMAKEYALPRFNSNGELEAVIYGGKIINLDYEQIDSINEVVFGNEANLSKPLGTVTIFQDDTRIATNVRNENGTRAVGTRVSAEVYEKVVEQGHVWHDRAFVVNEWYRTAYEPIMSINDKVIGILYVGILEEPFNKLTRNTMLLFVLIIIGGVTLAGILSLILISAVSRPITNLLHATEKLAGGELGCEASTTYSLTELNELAFEFNMMSAKLKERDENLNVSNAKLAELNKSYLDLIGFVSHELKGMLSSTIMNAYAIRDGYLGMINFKQKKAVDSISRNLDHLAATVKKFLNLSRIEKNQLEPNKTEFLIAQDVFEVSLDTFAKLASDKDMTIVNNIDEDLKVYADSDLMLIVANNLISNAIKYGNKNGRIELNCHSDEHRVTFEIYNDGRPISDDDKKKLFKRFSRLDVPEKKTEKGSGLGLFITKQIIETHGGDITINAEENGNTFVFYIERKK